MNTDFWGYYFIQGWIVLHFEVCGLGEADSRGLQLSNEWCSLTFNDGIQWMAHGPWLPLAMWTCLQLRESPCAESSHPSSKVYGSSNGGRKMLGRNTFIHNQRMQRSSEISSSPQCLAHMHSGPQICYRFIHYADAFLNKWDYCVNNPMIDRQLINNMSLVAICKRKMFVNEGK